MSVKQKNLIQEQNEPRFNFWMNGKDQIVLSIRKKAYMKKCEQKQSFLCQQEIEL